MSSASDQKLFCLLSEFAQCSNDLLMNLWGRKWSPRPIPPPSWLLPQSLGWEELLEKETATHSSILAWRIPWVEEPGGLQSMGPQNVGRNRAHTYTQQWFLAEVCP